MQAPSTTLGRDDLRPATSQPLLGERLRAVMWRVLRRRVVGTVGFAFGAMAMAGAAMLARNADV